MCQYEADIQGGKGVFHTQKRMAHLEVSDVQKMGWGAGMKTEGFVACLYLEWMDIQVSTPTLHSSYPLSVPPR